MRSFCEQTDTDKVCSICLDELAVGSMVSEEKENHDNENAARPRTLVSLDCTSMHVFHADCLRHWLKNKQICPYCREGIRIQESEN